MSSSSSIERPDEPLPRVLSKINYRHFHGLGGIFFLLVCAVSLARFAVTGQPSRSLDRLAGLALVPFLGGVLTKRFKGRLSHNDTKKDFFLRVGLWNLAFCGLCRSVYTLPASFWLDPNPRAIPWDCAAGTLLYAIGTVWSLLRIVVRLCRGIVVVRGTMTAVAFTYAVLFFGPVFHWCAGTPGLALAYQNHPIRESLYVVALLSGTMNAVDSFFFGLATAGRIPHETYHGIAMINWAVVYTGAVTGFLARLHESALVGVGTLGGIGLVYRLGSAADKAIIRRGNAYFKYKNV